MIVHDKKNRLVSLKMTDNTWLTVSDVAYKLHGLGVVQEAMNNEVKIFHHGRWDYALKHWGESADDKSYCAQ